MSHQYLKHAGPGVPVAQNEPIPGRNMVPNSAGGFVFAISDWARLRRFLVLGSEGGTFYVGERTFTKQNLSAVERCLAEDGPRVVREAVTISGGGRAPKNDPAIYVLAMAAGSADASTRKAALAALPEVCRIGTHLFHFAEFVEQFRGWGRGLKQAVSAWYTERSTESLQKQVVKYRQRDGWSHRDLLRLAHVRDAAPDKARVFDWVAHRGNGDGAVVVEGKTPKRSAPTLTRDDGILWAFEEVQRLDIAQKQDRARTIDLIGRYGLPWEALPPGATAHAEVQAALLPHMGLNALLRNLGNYTKSGLLAPLSNAARLVAERLGDREALTASRVHPIAVLSALKTYASGHGVRGGGEWVPVQPIVDALDDAFEAAFGNVVPSGKRIVLAVDVSSSMDFGTIAGVAGLSPRVAAAAMAMVTLRTEREVVLLAFSSGGSQRMKTPGGGQYHMAGEGISRIPQRRTLRGIRAPVVSRRTRLDDVVARFSGMPFGGTDCALPMLWASANRVAADSFVILTDNETWAGAVHPTQALADYRQRFGIGAKLVVVAMTSNGFTIADPNDAAQMDVVGFDSATPGIISDFIRGDLAMGEPLTV